LSLLLTGVLIFLGLLSLSLIALDILDSAGREGPLAVGAFLGSFMTGSFHYAAFFIPLYFWSCGLLLLWRPFRMDFLLILNYLILPFFTLGLSLRLFLSETALDSPLTELFARSFTRTGGAFLAALLFLLELVVIPQLMAVLARLFKPRGERRFLLAAPKPAPREAEDPLEADPAELEEVESADRREYLPMFAKGSVLASLPQRELEALPEEPEEPDDMPMPEPVIPIERGPEGPFDPEEPAPEAYQEGIEEEPDLPLLYDEVENEQAPRTPGRRTYSVPVQGLLSEYADGRYWEIDDETRRAGDILMATLEEFKIAAEVVGIRKGPVITMFEILPAPGVKLSKIVNLSDNIALRLAASSVRIVAPIPGRQAVGIEIPNKHRAIVSFAEMIGEENFGKSKMEIPLAIGKDITGVAQFIDLVQTPHLLIAGATGSGKSVCVNSIICSILYQRSPEEVKLILIDPKIVELKFYNDIPHLLTPVITEPKKAFQALQYAIYEMERRYSLLDGMGVRDIRSYNRKIKAKNIATTHLPYLVIVIDEFADLMATTGKELESTLARLAAMSRAVGIHLVLATQRPSIDVITGLIKANIPSRIAFMVAGKFDSRIIIDAVGAEKLLGRGDMLFTSAWDPFPLRMQGAYLSEEEVEKIVEYVKTLGEPDYIDDEIFIDDDEVEDFFEEDEEDPLMDKALEIITLAGKASASYLQRRLKIGYNRAARLVETMERRGIVGPQDGSKPRKILSNPD
jgi:S-DNA-T family DNA segregation ATPase FtsK/SpoIIIE